MKKYYDYILRLLRINLINFPKLKENRQRAHIRQIQDYNFMFYIFFWFNFHSFSVIPGMDLVVCFPPPDYCRSKK